LLPLDDPRWADLRTAYGSAHGIPVLLRSLRAPTTPDARDQVVFDLWSALAHQSDVYTASYAAVPHLVAASAEGGVAQRVELLHLAAAIEAFRHRRSSPEVPANLASAYHHAIGRLGDAACRIPLQGCDRNLVACVTGVIAIGAGQPRLGMAILNLESEVECPHCEQTFAPQGWDLDEPDD